MSNKSNDKGRGYEYAYLINLYQEISKIRKVSVEENSSYYSAKRAWESLNELEKSMYSVSALAGIKKIFELEPFILDGKDELELKLQSDDKGKEGDVRDVLLIRKGIEWQVGLSIKHNHTAVKHSRISKNIDFGKSWYDVSCSSEYWEDVNPVFDYLTVEKEKGTNWNELPNKEDDVYVPLLSAFIKEIKKQNEKFGDYIPKKLVEYLLGKFDFYKVIGIDSKQVTRIQGYNLRGNLNKRTKKDPNNIKTPKIKLPSRIVSIDFKPGSKSTVELYLDSGWQFDFRIHSASTAVETSLKFDIQIIGMPTTLISIDCKWNSYL